MAVNQEVFLLYFSRKVKNPVRACPLCGAALHALPCEVGQGLFYKMELCYHCDREQYLNTIEDLGLQLLPPMEEEDEPDQDELDDIPLTPRQVCLYVLGAAAIITAILAFGNLMNYVLLRH